MVPPEAVDLWPVEVFLVCFLTNVCVFHKTYVDKYLEKERGKKTKKLVQKKNKSLALVDI